MEPIPTPVEVVAPSPIPVEIVKDITVPPTIVEKRKEPRQNQETDPSRPARTTYQEDLVTAGQRNINLLWETTQGKVAMYVILGTLIIFGLVVIISLIANRDITTAQALLLGSIMSLATGVTSFYFSRTNHTATGGVGPRSFSFQEEHR